MILICGNCSIRNNVTEVQELKDLDSFTERTLLVSKCKNCGVKTVQLIEVRKADDRIFVDTFSVSISFPNTPI